MSFRPCLVPFPSRDSGNPTPVPYGLFGQCHIVLVPWQPVVIRPLASILMTHALSLGFDVITIVTNTTLAFRVQTGPIEPFPDVGFSTNAASINVVARGVGIRSFPANMGGFKAVAIIALA